MTHVDIDRDDPVLTELELSGLRVVADASEVTAMASRPGTTVDFASALRLGLDAFLADRRGGDAANAGFGDIVRATPDAFGIAGEVTPEALREALRERLLEDARATVVLLTPATLAEPAWRFPPEYGESTEDNWVFRILLPDTYPGLIWSVVDRTGTTAPYHYAIE